MEDINMSSGQVVQDQASISVERFSELKFSSSFEYGYQADVAETHGSQDSAELGTGFIRFKNARIAWTIHHDEVLIVIEGILRVHIDEAIHVLQIRDSMRLPAGTELVFETDNCLVAYARHLPGRVE
jgi:ethanolamine utilization protein EutQ